MRFVFIRGIGNVTQGKGWARLAKLHHQRCQTRPHCHDWRCHWNLLCHVGWLFFVLPWTRTELPVVMTASHKVHHADYAVVGSGVAGLRAAIELSQTGSVLVLAKSDLSDSATAWAQGGLAVALSDEDEISLHEQDTIKAGDGLCRADVVALLVEEGPKYITELIEWGTEFDRAGTKLAFTREAAHSRSCVLHAHGDSTGREISRALLARAHSIPHLHLRAHAFTTDLIAESGNVVGLRFIDEMDGSLHELRAEALLLATGGLGQIYRETTNPDVATGDGMAIAYAAGAALSDMAFVQVHPTALAVKRAPPVLLSVALRVERAILRHIRLAHS